MPTVKTCLASLLIATASTLPADAQDALPADLTPGASLPQSELSLATVCDRVDAFDIEPTRFPSSLERESHRICHGLQLTDGTMAGNAVFTFADDRLVMSEVRGAGSLLSPQRDPDVEVWGFEVYLAEWVLVDVTRNRVIAIEAPDLLPLALSWDNPYWTGAGERPGDTSLAWPAALDFGASLEATLVAAEAICPHTMLREIDEVWLGTAPERQQQLDCYGPELAGYPRKIEFIFGDGILQQAWVMFGAGDTARLRDALTGLYGPAIAVNDTYEIFDDWRIALRKDIVEVRMGTQTLADFWRADWSEQGSD